MRSTCRLIVSWIPAWTKRQRWIAPAGTVSDGCTIPLMLVKRPFVSQIVGEKSCESKFSTTPLLILPAMALGLLYLHVQRALADGGGLLEFASAVVYRPCSVMSAS